MTPEKTCTPPVATATTEKRFSHTPSARPPVPAGPSHPPPQPIQTPEELARAARAEARMANPPDLMYIGALFARHWNKNAFILGICTRCRHPYLTPAGERVLNVEYLTKFTDRKKMLKFMLKVQFVRIFFTLQTQLIIPTP